MKSPFFASLLLSTSFVSLTPTSAHACSASFCGEPAGFPTTATLPANAGGVFLNPGHGPGDLGLPTPELILAAPGSEAVGLTVLPSDRSVGVFLRTVVHTPDALPVGATLTLRAGSRCDAFYAGDSGTPAPIEVRSWTITEAVPLPTTLGTLQVTVGPRTVPQPTWDGSCDVQEATVGASVDLTLASDAAPWSDVFVYETVVDGAVFLPIVTASPFNGYSGQSQAFGGSWLGRGTDFVFANCGAVHGGVAPGAHTVFLRGILPDGTIVTTNESTFELTCTSEPVDAGTRPPDTDAGVEEQMHLQGGPCSAAPGFGTSDRSTVFGLVFAVAAALGFRRRRR